MIINTEWGDCVLPAASLGITLEEDAAVDRDSANPGHGLFEKLISGLYIGDVVRRVLVRIASETGLLGGRLLTLDRLEFFDGAAVSRAFHDDSGDLGDIGALFADRAERETTLYERQMVKDVCSTIATRSARLCAAAMAAVAARERRGGDGGGDDTDDTVVISVDGSMFTKFPGYRGLVNAAIDEMRSATAEGHEEEAVPPIEITLADGSSVSGAAICAAVFTMSG
jgi:hexokinase